MYSGFISFAFKVQKLSDEMILKDEVLYCYFLCEGLCVTFRTHVYQNSTNKDIADAERREKNGA